MASDLISGIYVQISGMACLHPGFLTRRKKLGLLQIKGGVEPTTNWRLQFDSRLKGIGASSTLVAATAKLMHMLDRDSSTTYACMHCREGVASGFNNKTRYTPYVSPESQISYIAINKVNIKRQCRNT